MLLPMQAVVQKIELKQFCPFLLCNSFVQEVNDSIHFLFNQITRGMQMESQI